MLKSQMPGVLFEAQEPDVTDDTSVTSLLFEPYEDDAGEPAGDMRRGVPRDDCSRHRLSDTDVGRY
jgi:hypothetical protein